MSRPTDEDGDDLLIGLGRSGGDWRGLRPTFDNPLSWSLPLARLGGMSIRIHLFFLIYIVVQQLRSIVPAKGVSAPLDETLTAIWMASLLMIVLAHELGHCLACRLRRGRAEEILMWPLGGLAVTRPPHRWHDHLATALGGPLVNAAICMIAGTSLGFSTGWWIGLAIPNPIEPFGALHAFPALNRSLVHQILVIINGTSLVMLLVNLCPIFPLDGARILQALLWPALGYQRAMVAAVRTGFVAAIVLAVFAAVTGSWMLVGVAIFGFAVCHVTQKQIEWTDSILELEPEDELALSLPGRDEHAQARQAPIAGGSDRERLASPSGSEPDELEIDRILQKIGQRGIESLTGEERAKLQRETERKRQGH